jgi:4,5-DOPA dioxygenase extradiol
LHVQVLSRNVNFTLEVIADAERAESRGAVVPSTFHAEVEAGAFDAFLRERAPESREQRPWAPTDGALPTLYLSHGAPPLFNDAHWMTQLFDWALTMPKPTAVLIVSAHWESAPVKLSSPDPSTPLVYDFGGFAPVYYRMTYPTPSAQRLADAVAALMPDTEPVHVAAARGLDHGAWVPLKVMYPYADVPVLQLSLPTHDPVRLMELGRRLRPLRDDGVLVVGSGFMTHGLRFATYEMFVENKVPGWSADFDAWAAQALADVDWDRLAGFRGAPGMPYAHPTVEHFTPLFVTLGAASAPAVPTTPIDDFMFGFAKRSLQLS